MARLAAVVALLASLAASSVQVQFGRSLDEDAAAQKGTYALRRSGPGCWCETQLKAKTEAVADARQKVSDLTSRVEELSARSSQLEAQIRAEPRTGQTKT